MYRYLALWVCIMLLAAAGFGQNAETTASEAGKIALEAPAAQSEAKGQENDALAKQLTQLPDGVLRVKTNDDGSFKSLLVKATVEMEDSLGSAKAIRLARKEAELACKKALAQWLEEYCAFAEGSDKKLTIVTKGEAAKDAAGNTVKLRKQESSETKTIREDSASVSKAVLRGLVVLSSMTNDQQEYELVMGLSQESLDQAEAVKAALSSKKAPAAEKAAAPAKSATEQSGSDAPVQQKKVNPDVEKFL